MPWRETEEKKEEEEEENVGSPGGKLEISEARSRLRIYEEGIHSRTPRESTLSVCRLLLMPSTVDAFRRS